MGEIEVHDNIVSGESTPTETRDKTFFNPTKLSWVCFTHYTDQQEKKKLIEAGSQNSHRRRWFHMHLQR